MAFNSANFHKLCGGPQSRQMFYYHDTAHPDAVEAAGFINNKDDDQNLQKGDLVFYMQWTTAVYTGTLTRFSMFAVSNVIANDAASSAGAVNLAQVLGLDSGIVSSLT